MTREEEIINAAREYNNGVTFSNPSNVLHFEAGAKWADEHPKSSWISCKDKLPYEFENLLRKNNRKCTLPVLVYNKKTDSIKTDFMIKELYYWDKKIWSWYFNDKNHITHWRPLPDKPQM